MGKLKEKVAGELEKISSGFQYIPGSIRRLSPDDDEPLTIQELEEAKAENLCARCLINGGLNVEIKDGHCPNCGAKQG